MSEPPRASDLAEALAAGDAEERRLATARLGALGASDAIPLLLRALGDEDWRVRKEATVAARAHNADPALVAALLGLLQDAVNIGLRNAVVDVLASTGAAATMAVSERLVTLDPDGRKLAVEILGRSRDPDALGALEAALGGDEDPNVRQAAAEAIAELGLSSHADVAEVLARCLDDEDPVVRLSALEGLAALGAPVAWDRLEPLVQLPTLRPAALAMAALSESPRAAPTLARALATARGGSFWQALGALGRLADGPDAAHVAEALRAEGSPLLEKLVAIARESGSAAPAQSLRGGGWTNQRATALVLAALARAPGVAEAALAALGEQSMLPHAQRALLILGATAVPAIVAHLGSPTGDPDERAVAIEVAAEIAESAGAACPELVSEVLPALRTAARDRDLRVAAGALLALSRIGAVADLGLAAELTRSEEVAIAHAAEDALATLALRHPAGARELCARVLADGAVSLTAVLVVGALGSRGEAILPDAGADVALLAHASASGDARTRRAAVAAVADVGLAQGAAPTEVLGFALADEERSVQLAAARGLGRLAVPVRLAGPDGAPPSQPVARWPRVAELLERVGGTGDVDLLAAAVRSLGDALTAAFDGTRASLRPASDELGEIVDALEPLAANAPNTVALAAVDALARATEAPGRADAIARALEHEDSDVVRAAILKLPTVGGTYDATRLLTTCLEHPSPDVRALATEMLDELDPKRTPSGRPDTSSLPRTSRPPASRRPREES